MSMHRCIDIPMYLSVVFRGHPPSPRAAQRYRKAVWDQLCRSPEMADSTLRTD